MRLFVLLLVLSASLTGCVHSSTTFSYTALHQALPRLRATGEAHVDDAWPSSAWVHMSDRLTLRGGSTLTVAELTAPCALVPQPGRPDLPRCPLDDGGSAARVAEDPGATTVLWGSLALLLASIIAPIACFTACHDTGWEVASAFGMGFGLVFSTVGLLSLMGP